jgi:hypothetical protein
MEVDDQQALVVEQSNEVLNVRCFFRFKNIKQEYVFVYCLQLHNLNLKGGAWCALSTQSHAVLETYALNAYMNYPNGMFMYFMSDKSKTELQLEKLQTKVVTKLNKLYDTYDFSRNEYTTYLKPRVQELLECPPVIGNGPMLHILCHHCKVFGKKLPFVSDEKNFLCSDCFRMNSNDQYLYKRSSYNDIAAKSDVHVSMTTEQLNQKKREIKHVYSLLAKELKDLVNFIAIGHVSLSSDGNIDLNVLNVVEMYREKFGAGSAIMESLCSYALWQNKFIRVTMSNVYDEIQPWFYMKFCKLFFFLHDFSRICDDGSFVLVQSPQQPINMEGFDKAVVRWFVILIQRYIFFRRFQNPNGLDQLHYSVYNCMLTITESTLTTLCLEILQCNFDVHRDVRRYLNFLMYDGDDRSFKLSNDYQRKKFFALFLFIIYYL